MKQLIPGASGYTRNFEDLKKFENDQTPYGKAMHAHCLRYMADYKQIVRDVIFGRELVNRMTISGVLPNSAKKM